MNVTLTQTQRRWVESRVRAAGYRSASEYVRELIQRDRLDSSRTGVDAKLLEGLRSPAVVMTAANWKALDERILRRAKARRR